MIAFATPPAPTFPAGSARALLCCLALVAGCSTGPQADYPALLPTAQILAEPALPAHASAARDPAAAAATTEAASARADALRRRAQGLRGPVIDPASRDRMRRATE